MYIRYYLTGNIKGKAQLDTVAATGYGREVNVCLCAHMQVFLLVRVKVKAKKENKSDEKNGCIKAREEQKRCYIYTVLHASTASQAED